MLRQYSVAEVVLAIGQLALICSVCLWFVHLALCVWLREYVKSYEVAFTKIFYDPLRLFRGFPAFYMQVRYIWPLTEAPIELAQYSASVQARFWAARIVGTIAAFFFFGGILIVTLARLSPH